MRFVALFISVIFISGCSNPSNSWYLGEWTVSGVEFPGVSALGAEDAQAWFGSEAVYSQSHFSFRETTCETPQYEIQSLTKLDFQMDYRAAFSQLGIDGEAVDILSVSCSGMSVFPGGTLIKASGDMLYLPWDGAFFRLGRGASVAAP